MQQAIEAHLQATLPYDGILFQDTTNAPQAVTEREAALAAGENIPQEGEEKIADGVDAHDEAGTAESEHSEVRVFPYDLPSAHSNLLRCFV